MKFNSNCNNTALILAVDKGKTEMVKLLLMHEGIDTNIQNILNEKRIYAI